HTNRGGHLGGHGAALTDLTHEDDVVNRNRIFGFGDDLAERRQLGVRNVVARVLPGFAYIDHLELTTRYALAHLFGTQPTERFGRRFSMRHMGSILSPLVDKDTKAASSTWATGAWACL